MKKYRVGYVPGSFDLFHIGHLNLLSKAKEQCDYLIAGVVTDEVYINYKYKKPIIPFRERIMIVQAIKYVDEVVAVDFSNFDKIKAWNLYRYDCHFAGDDHINDWDDLKIELGKLGADLVFFEYTKSNSSTNIRNTILSDISIDKKLQNNKDKTIVAFGAGYIFDNYMQKYGERYKPSFVIDNNASKWGGVRNGAIIKSPQVLLEYPRDELFIVVCSIYYREIATQLQDMGVENIHGYYEK